MQSCTTHNLLEEIGYPDLGKSYYIVEPFLHLARSPDAGDASLPYNSVICGHKWEKPDEKTCQN
jgi:hypothetical protein